MLEWYGRFDVLVTHDPLPRAQVDALHRHGTKLALYEWSVAFYASHATPWQRTLAPAALLNRTPLRGHLGATDADAFYYDPATREHERERAPALVRRLRTLGYDGVFLDTTTVASVHPEALAEYERRHAGSPYDEVFARFLAKLRAELGKDGVIVTNQGFRAAAQYLPYADWEVTESLITYPHDGGLVLRPWLEENDRWNSTAFLMPELLGPVQREYPKVRFAHLNYLDALDPRRVEEIVAIARYFGAEAFVTLPSLAADARSDIYFADLGAARPRREGYRFFARGLVVVNRGSGVLRIPNPGGAAYEDVVTGERFRGRTLLIPRGRALVLRKVAR
ncbi:MAG: hypothetical protein QOH21_542 [Acidobacteriota bacterium]|nr:hypothetical protein [Acidobacteriota bacterium]